MTNNIASRSCNYVSCVPGQPPPCINTCPISGPVPQPQRLDPGPTPTRDQPWIPAWHAGIWPYPEYSYQPRQIQLRPYDFYTQREVAVNYPLAPW